jgi:hypothetical protein
MSELLHILWTPTIGRPWWRTDERCNLPANERVWTDCCGCKMPAEETETRLVESWDPPLGGMGCYQEEPMPWAQDRCELSYYPTGAYFDPHWDTRCADGFGCTVNPRKKCGRELRETWRYSE